MKKLIISSLILLSTIFGQIRELNGENFEKATARGLVVVEFFAPWNEANKVILLDEWAEDQFDAKVYRVNIELHPSIQSNNDVVILPTIIFYDGGEEVKRLQGDMVREANSNEVLELKKENERLKQFVAEIALKNRVLKKSLNGTDLEDIDL